MPVIGSMSVLSLRNNLAVRGARAARAPALHHHYIRA
jgi:hypothetical protein